MTIGRHSGPAVKNGLNSKADLAPYTLIGVMTEKATTARVVFILDRQADIVRGTLCLQIDVVIGLVARGSRTVVLRLLGMACVACKTAISASPVVVAHVGKARMTDT